METCSVVLTFESVYEILYCDHSNKTSLAVLLHGNPCFSILNRLNLEFFLNFDLGTLLGIKELNKPTFSAFSKARMRFSPTTFLTSSSE